jgi:hypothetical protein
MSDCFLISDVVFKPFPLKEDVRPGAATSSTISQMKIYWLNILNTYQDEVSTTVKRFCLTLLQTKK